MLFGKVKNLQSINFNIPPDHPDTNKTLEKYKNQNCPKLFVGHPTWKNSKLLPTKCSTKDELAYYATQFNSIELNATFYRIFPADVFASWYEKTPADFRFFPKVFQGVSHWKRLNDFENYLNEYLLNASNLKEKLEMPFVQMHSNFSPKGIDRLPHFFEAIPKDVRIAIEFRHTDWFNDAIVANELYEILENYKVSNVLVDSAGRRDLLHMRMTSPSAFIRYNGANHKSDYTRLDDWIDRLEQWVAQGLQNIYFFVHQNLEKASPLLSAHFIKKANERFGTALHIPQMNDPKTLF